MLKKQRTFILLTIKKQNIMGFTVRKEEYSTLGDFIRTSFIRDQGEILARYPKLNVSFLAAFESKLERVKVLESTIVFTQEQKEATKGLHVAGEKLNKELNFLVSYMNKTKLSSDAVSDLKKDLHKKNFDGAVLKIEGVKQFVEKNSSILVPEGMSPGLPADLLAVKTNMATLNALQNKLMNDRKEITRVNKKEYKALYDFIAEIAEAGRLVFSDSNVKDEYTFSKIVHRMRKG